MEVLQGQEAAGGGESVGRTPHRYWIPALPVPSGMVQGSGSMYRSGVE